MERPDKTEIMFLCELYPLKTLHNSLTKKLHFLHLLAQFVGQITYLDYVLCQGFSYASKYIQYMLNFNCNCVLKCRFVPSGLCSFFALLPASVLQKSIRCPMRKCAIVFKELFLPDLILKYGLYLCKVQLVSMAWLASARCCNYSIWSIYSSGDWFKCIDVKLIQVYQTMFLTR